MSDSIIAIAEVTRLTSLAERTIYKRMNEGKFPPRIKIGRRTGWSLEEIQAWIQELKAQR